MPQHNFHQGSYVSHADYGHGHVAGYGREGHLAVRFRTGVGTHVLHHATLTAASEPSPSKSSQPRLETKPKTTMPQVFPKPVTKPAAAHPAPTHPVPPAKKGANKAPAAAKPTPAAKPAPKPPAAKKEPVTPPAEGAAPAAKPVDPKKELRAKLRAKLKDVDTRTALEIAGAAGLFPTPDSFKEFLIEFMEAGISGDYPWLRKRFIAAVVAEAGK